MKTIASLVIFGLGLVLASAESNPESNASPDPQYVDILANAVNAYSSVDPEVFTPVVNTQYHAQSELGEYSYGYSNPTSTKVEAKNANGVVEGSYSYLSPDGRIITNNYVADPYGFRSSLAPSNGDETLVPVPVFAADVANDPIAVDIGSAIATQVYENRREPVPAPVPTPARRPLRVHQAVPLPEPNLIQHAVEHHLEPFGAVRYASNAPVLEDYFSELIPAPKAHHVQKAYIEPQQIPVVQKAYSEQIPVVQKAYSDPIPVVGKQYSQTRPFVQKNYKEPIQAVRHHQYREPIHQVVRKVHYSNPQQNYVKSLPRSFGYSRPYYGSTRYSNYGNRFYNRPNYYRHRGY